MKKIENGVVKVILFEEFDLDGYIKERYVVEKMAVGGVDESHGILLSGDDGLAVGLEVVEPPEHHLAVEVGKLMVVGELHVCYGAVAFEMAFEWLGVGDAGDQQQLGVELGEL